MEITHLNSARFNGPASLAAPKPEQGSQNRQLAQAVRSLNQNQYANSGRELSYSIDSQTRQPVVRIIDSNTKAVLEQLPSEDVLRLAQYFARTAPAESTQKQAPPNR